MSLPLVSIGIPLYRSRRFADRVVRNITAIAYPNVEVIVSDRHGDDDAADEIARRLANDRRVRVVAAADQLTWVEHYNWLLDSAAGTYFMWMPHDDEFPSHYVGTLVAALEERPDVVLAYGGIERVDLDGRRIDRPSHDRPRPARDGHEPAAGRPWSPRAAAARLVRRETEAPFRGVFRREVVRRAGLFIRSTPGNVAADTYWVFALALLGPFERIDGCVCRKAYYPESTHARWGAMGLRQIVDGRRMLRGYVADLVRDPAEAAACVRGIDRWAAVATTGVIARHCRIPAGVRRAGERALSRLLS